MEDVSGKIFGLRVQRQKWMDENFLKAVEIGLQTLRSKLMPDGDTSSYQSSRGDFCSPAYGYSMGGGPVCRPVTLPLGNTPRLIRCPTVATEGTSQQSED